jgi:DNA-binding response OmpR family regulator
MPANHFSFDFDSGVLVSMGRVVSLPRREATVLQVLLSRQGKVVTKTYLHESVYRGDDEPETENVTESHVSKLRKKILPLGLVISSERFKGYTLTVSPGVKLEGAL